MKPPRPIVVIVLLILLAVSSASRVGDRTGALAAGYTFGALVIPGLLAAAYVWWYRRRTNRPDQ